MSLSSLRLVFLLSPDESWSRDAVAVELSICPGSGQDPEGHPETLEADVTPVSILHLAHACNEGAEILFHLCESSRKSSKCICDV